MPKPTVAGRYFEMLKSEIEAADYYSSKIIMQNTNAYCTNIKMYAVLPPFGHAVINAVLRGAAALGVALGEVDMGAPDKRAVDSARALLLADVERLGFVLETSEPSRRWDVS